MFFLMTEIMLLCDFLALHHFRTSINHHELVELGGLYRFFHNVAVGVAIVAV